jgi:hypothetical protein
LGADYVLADLPGRPLAPHRARTIYREGDAAGKGWLAELARQAVSRRRATERPVAGDVVTLAVLNAIFAAMSRPSP